jgi:hypothetical protein
MALVLQTALSYILSQSKTKIIQSLSDTLGYKLGLKDISFDLIRGVRLNGLSIFYDRRTDAVASFKDVFIGIKISALFFKKIEPGRIFINECTLLSRKEKEGINLQIIFSDIYRKLPEIKDLSVAIALAKVIYLDDNFKPTGIEFWLKRAAIFLYHTSRVRVKGDCKVIYKSNPENYLFRYLDNKDITQDFKYVMDATMNGKQLIIDSLLLSLGKEEIIGTGSVKDFAAKNPYIDIGFMAGVLPLTNITFLEENFRAFGYTSISLRFTGALDDVRGQFNGNFFNGYLEFTLPSEETFNINNIDGWVEYKNDTLILDNVRLKLNNLPLFMDMKIKLSKEPDIYLKMRLTKDFLVSQKLPLSKIEALFKGKISDTLTGNLEVKTVYLRKGSEFEMQANFNNIEFDYLGPKQKYLKIKNFELFKNNIDNIQKLIFENFESKVELPQDYLNIKNINFTGYSGTLKGALSVELGDKPNLNLILNGYNLDIKKLTQDMQLTNKFLSGNLNTKIEFNNYAREFLKGDCYVSDGTIDLSALAEAVKLPSLENINFNIVHVYFAVSRELVKMRGIKLSSPDIRLNAFWNIDNRIEGVMNAKISAALLNKSPQFQKLLSISRVDKPFIDFKFLLGGTPKTMRAMWMKGDFKEKLEQESPEWVKRRIEMGLDKMVDDLSNR